MAKVELISDKSMVRITAELEDVNVAVWTKTEEIGGKAKASLAQHRETGNAKIEVEFTADKDGVVSLVDPAAESIEWGHWFYGFGAGHPMLPRYVAGLYILTRAAGLA